MRYTNARDRLSFAEDELGALYHVGVEEPLLSERGFLSFLDADRPPTVRLEGMRVEA